MIANTNTSKSFDFTQIASWFDQASQVVSAFSQTNAPDVVAQNKADADAAAAKNKKTWQIFIGIAILIIILLIGFIVIKKS